MLVVADFRYLLWMAQWSLGFNTKASETPLLGDVKLALEHFPMRGCGSSGIQQRKAETGFNSRRHHLPIRGTTSFSLLRRNLRQ